jgi:rubrerythrin
VDSIRLIRRAARIEITAAEIYEILARRSSRNRAVRRFWAGMAADERKHAKKLTTWRQLLERSTAAPLDLGGLDRAIHEVELLARDLRARAESATTVDDAFAIALTLESSEIDVIYTTLLQRSPIARFPDLEETRRTELGRHREALLEMVRAHSNDEHNRTMAALLAAEDS